MIELTCDICGEKVKPAPNQAQANRNLGLHKKVAHGIGGLSPSAQYSQGISKKIGRPRKYPEGATPEQLKQLEEARQKKREERERAKQREAASQVHPLPLPQCPKCGGEFLVRRAGKTVPIRLTMCSECNMRFYYAEG